MITLRGLDIAGVPGAAPLPLYGIDVQNAGAVHIEKSSISNFTQPTSACINAAPSAPVIVYVNDSFLRECRTGVNVNGTALPASGDPAVLFADNTRIENGRATSGPSYGVWLQGYAAVSMRNSQILANDTGIQMDNLAANGVSNLVLAQSQVIGGNSGLNVVNASAGAYPEVTIVGSQFYGFDDGIVYSNAGPGARSADR